MSQNNFNSGSFRSPQPVYGQSQYYTFQPANNYQPTPNQQHLPVIPSPPHAQTNPSSNIFESIKNMVYQLSVEKSGKEEKMTEAKLEKQIEQSKMITSLNHQLSYLKEVVNQKQKKLRQSEENYQKVNKQALNKHRKEIKKYIDLVTQKESENQNLKKTIKSLTNRSLSLSSEIETLTQSKTALENTILKSIESMRSNVKEFNYSLQQNELDKVVLQGKYKQLCDKVEQVVKQSQQCEAQKSKVEKKYEKLKQTYEGCRNQCIELKFQVQRYKIKMKDFTDAEQKIISRMKTENNRALNKEDRVQGIDSLKQQALGFLQALKRLQYTSQRIENGHGLSAKLSEMVKQNQNLKLLLQSRQIQNDQLKLKLLGPRYEDEILKNRNFSLFTILSSKKDEILNMEQKIEEIQRLAISAEELLHKRFDPAPLTQPNTESLVNYGDSHKTKNRTRNQELIQELQAQKQKAIADLRQNFEKIKQKDKLKIGELESENISLKKQNERLKYLNEALEKDKKNYKYLLQEMMGENQPKKKKSGKTKAKLRCYVCFAQFTNSSKIIKCPQCPAKIHAECIKNHECRQISDTDSNQN